MEIITKSAEETEKVGREFGNKLTGGEVVALVGNLGGGKTTFVKGIARGLGIDLRIISPTFILMRKYKSSKGMLYHIDVYRLDDNLEEELENLGIKDVWGKKANIVVIEWADKIKHLLPRGITKISFEYLDDDVRKINIHGPRER